MPAERVAVLPIRPPISSNALPARAMTALALCSVSAMAMKFRTPQPDNAVVPKSIARPKSDQSLFPVAHAAQAANVTSMRTLSDEVAGTLTANRPIRMPTTKATPPLAARIAATLKRRLTGGVFLAKGSRTSSIPRTAHRCTTRCTTRGASSKFRYGTSGIHDTVVATSPTSQPDNNATPNRRGANKAATRGTSWTAVCEAARGHHDQPTRISHEVTHQAIAVVATNPRITTWPVKNPAGGDRTSSRALRVSIEDADRSRPPITRLT